MVFYKNRRDGSEQPSSAGPLRLRLPFLHYKLELPDWIQGAILSVVPMSITAIMLDVLGIPFEIAIAFVIINNFMYLLHTHFGDPSVVGWITAGIPLYVAFLTGFPEGEPRILALIALQLTIAFIFLFMGIFKGADFLVKKVPLSLKAGILFGAGFSAIFGEFAEDGRVWDMPWTILVGATLGFFMMFSNSASPLRERYSLFRYVAQYGIAIPFVIAYVIGIIISEVSVPSLTWNIVSIPFTEIVSNYSVFAVGFPSFEYFIQALPLAIAAYIIAFGDVLVVDSMLNKANEVRKDEKVVFRPGRNSIITSIRNFFQAIFMPFVGLSGPQWIAGQTLVTSRFMNNPRSVVDSYWGGATGVFWGMSFALMLGPLVSIIQPGVSLGMALTMLIQGYLCGHLAMELLKDSSNLQKGIAVIIGAVLVAKGAAWALAIGIVLWLALEIDWTRNKGKKQEQEYTA